MKHSLQARLAAHQHGRGVAEIVVNRDYAQSYVLAGIAATPALSSTLVFKGGTALKKVFFGAGYRFSEDLDFSTSGAPTGEALERAVHAAISSATRLAQEESPLTFTVERYKEKLPHPTQDAFTVRAQFPWQSKPLVPVLIEITHDEPIVIPPTRRSLIHGYDEVLDVDVLSYAVEEIVIEKLRASRQSLAKLEAKGWMKPRARDFYDLSRIIGSGMAVDWATVAAALEEKCSARKVEIKSLDDVFDPALCDEVRASWERQVGDFVANPPDVDVVLTELRKALDERLPALR